MPPTPEFRTYDVDGVRLGALYWEGIDGAPTVVAIHGITATSWAWDPVAHHLSGGAHLVAVDLRGRGRSWRQPPPFTIARHADDLAEIIRQLGGPLTVVAHSTGCHVALSLAERHPDLVRSLVLVDGGTPLFLPDPPMGSDGRPSGTDRHIDRVVEASLGPALERLETIWPDRVSYYAMWAQHPAFVEGIGSDLERNLLADLVETEGGFRVAVNTEAVRVGGRELFADDEIRSALARCTEPATIIRAEFGLMGTPPPLIDDETVGEYPQHRWVRADGLNHYTVISSPRGATLVVDAIRAALTAL